MKANEAPEKLYLLSNGLISYCRNTDEDVEYIRTDALIEKACKFLDKELPITDLSSSNMLDITFKVFDKENKKVFIENFKAYMKRECEIWQSTELNIDTLVTMVDVFLMMATLFRSLKKGSFQTNGLISKVLEIESELKSYWKY